MGAEDGLPVIEVWRVPDGLTFESVSGKLEDLGYRPIPGRVAFRPSAAAAVPILLYVADAISGAAASELVRGIAEWARGKVRRRKGGTTVRILYGPDLKVLAEVEVPDDE